MDSCHHNPTISLPVVSNPRTQEQPLTMISVRAVMARWTEFFTNLPAESRSKYRSEFRSIFTTFVQVFFLVIADDVTYTLACLPCLYLFTSAVTST